MEIGDIIDGEIYVHGENFQDIISALKNVKSKSKATLDCELLEFHIYDVADDGFSFQHRWKVFENKFKDVDGYIYFDFIKLVPTYIATNENDIHAYHKQFVEEGYEGVIIRNRDGKYEFKHRSNNLQKLKFFHDEEYKIIGVKGGTGRYENCGTFICETKDGKTFDCNMKGTIEQKEEFLSNKDYYIGKLLTVKYQEKSKDNIPRFPVGISVRDYE